VRNLQPVIEERVDALLARLHEDGRSPDPQPLDILYPFSAFTNDVINEYAFAKCDHLTEHPDYGRDVTDYLLTGTHYGKIIQHAEIVLNLITALPERISAAIIPGWRGFLKMKHSIRQQIASIQATQDTSKWQLDVSHPTIFHDLLSSKILPPQEKTLTRLGEEGQTLVQAGTLTASWTLAIVTFHLLDKPHLLRRLRDELIAHIPDPQAVVPLDSLRQLPFLRAVMKEGLRHSYGAAGRSARVCPDETLTYVDPKTSKSYAIPPGVPVGMTNYKTLTDPDIYPDPFAYRPERWLEDGETSPQHLERMERYFTAFSGGARACLGIWLAQAELTMCLAKLWRVWGGEEEDEKTGLVGRMKLYETTARDALMAADYFIPIPWKGTKGIRVILESLQV